LLKGASGLASRGRSRFGHIGDTVFDVFGLAFGFSHCAVETLLFVVACHWRLPQVRSIHLSTRWWEQKFRTGLTSWGMTDQVETVGALARSAHPPHSLSDTQPLRPSPADGVFCRPVVRCD